MNTIDKLFFEALHKDRTDSANTFEKPSTREMWRSIVEKYSDQAHFIYELIQNADDAGATNARFILEPERLIFAHNGKRHFSISNPKNEDTDSKEGQLGDINAITGIAFSNKKTQENKIGKFGVGFKAVFQYTATPRIYDPEVYFRIDRYIVPSEIKEDFPGRKSDETLFVFPFDHKDRNPQETYIDIENKLRTLKYPVLFLINLSDISFEIESFVGRYYKRIIEKNKYKNGTVAEKICLSYRYSNDNISKCLWLFTRYEDGLKYSVGFLIDKKNKLLSINEPAFCFFPTRETTGLNFLIHAPFLLTDSREGIRAGVPHNNNLINLLAKLAGDSLLYLREIGKGLPSRIINDDIFSIVPVDENSFCGLDDRDRISFMPFYTEIKHIFDTRKIVPTRSGYTTVKNAYWAAVPFLSKLFSDEQLGDICGNQNAEWAIVSLGHDEIARNNRDLYKYINSIVATGLNEDHLLKGGCSVRNSSVKGITGDFIEKQCLEWLHRFYKWLSETSHRTEFAKFAPIFWDQNSKAAAVFDNNSEHPKLFLPSDNVFECNTVHEDLLKNKDTLNWIKKIGVAQPTIRDQIYNVIIPQHKNNGEIDAMSHFMKFFEYYQECPQKDLKVFMEDIKDLKFINYYSKSELKLHHEKASNLYMPTESLCEYFSAKPITKFVALEEYKLLVGVSNKICLESFFQELGVKVKPEIIERHNECYIDGLSEIINKIVEKKDATLSTILWDILCDFCEDAMFSSKIRSGEYSTTYDNLVYKSWLINKDGEFVSADNMTRFALANIYSFSHKHVYELYDLLKIKKISALVGEAEDDSNLTDIQREKMQYADLAMKYDISQEEAEEMFRQKAEQKKRTAQSATFPNPYKPADDLWEDDGLNGSIKRIPKSTSKVVKDIIKRISFSPFEYQELLTNEPDDIDEDEFIPSPVNFSRKAEFEKEKAVKAIDKIVHQDKLQQRALDAEKYTYGWFKALLELEVLNSNTNNLNSKEVSITFVRVEREPGTHRTLVLKQPNRYIPQFMEDLADIPLLLRFGEQTKTLAIEVANIKSYTLRVKLKSHVDISDLDFSKVTEARIDAKSPVFLLEELRKQFVSFNYEDDYDMQKNLCENIEFIFGPPGTGKTTHLAKNVIIPLMKGNDELKVLVLTPTNKSADVLVRRTMDIMKMDNSYNDWLIRFGGTGDEVIEQSIVYRDKTFDIRTLKKSVTVTTVARFPYDFFMPQGTRMFLNGINWDYIIIDEASMIPLVNIIYPLYKKTPNKFIIAGDPFQIEPITSVDLWKNENIYTMVELDSFVNPHTIPYDYQVELLTKQYRSIPSVGSIFSKFTYGGILQHYRDESKRRPLNLDSTFDIKPLNIIKFPVSKYESIYSCKRLQHSSAYQVYSALFTFEYSLYFARALAKANPGQLFRIGIIAPYRAQSDLIEKLISSEDVPSEIDIQVGTIHGFQGDECDIIFVVFNTPPKITSSKDMFLNKRNIINVSISRAKDYLFLIMPDDNTENINNLRLVKQVEQLIKSSNSYSESQTPILENMMFDSPTYLEDNSFSTGHQSVNVYGLPEKRYEIRSEDTAIDIQIQRPLEVFQSADTKNIENKGTISNIDIPMHKADTPPKATNLVYSPKYGEGIITARIEHKGKIWITVKFSSKTTKFDEVLAFNNKALILINQ